MDRVINGILRRGLCTSRVSRCVSSSNVRNMFLEYFEKEHDHLVIPSSPVLPHRDATLSFVNSGMNQFKDVFLGLARPASKRVVNYQKCIRLKGKHNDLELVGLDGYHHTFFEMLGNWSFGDYFKKEACLMSWNLLTNVYKIPQDRLYVTYFAGDEALNLPPDVETREIWAEIGVPPNRILPFGMKENFWEMGSTGPCGPCTEIHYDHEGRGDASSLVNAGSPSVTEIWNLVFTEFNRTQNGLERLGQYFVDTGMGFERLVAVLQGQTSNYETDIFRPLFDVIQKVSGHSGYSGRYDGDQIDVAYRVLADHVRMLTVALSDGMLPNMQNKVREVFRRAWMLSTNTFKVDNGMIKELSNHVAEYLAPAYPEIGKNMGRVHYIIEREEESLRQKEETVSKAWAELVVKHPKLKNMQVDRKREFLTGYKFLEKNNIYKDLSSENAWILLDTLGVPLKSIEALATILGLNFDPDAYGEYNKTMVLQQKNINEEKFQSQRNISQRASIEIPGLGPEPTLDHFKYEDKVDSTGSYACDAIPVEIRSIVVDGKIVDSIGPYCSSGNDVAIVFDKTNCFHETTEFKSDKASFEHEQGTEMHIMGIKKVGNKLLHYPSSRCFPLAHEIKVNSKGTLKPVESFRLEITRSNTGLQLFKAVLNEKFKTLMEMSCFAAKDLLMLAFTHYDENLTLKDLLELENATCKIIETGAAVEREMCNVKDFNKMDHVIRKPGQSFIESKIPICKITNKDFTARLPSCGPLLHNVSDLEDFVITNYKKTKYRTREITAVVGEKAKVARQRNSEFLQKWEHIRDFHVAEFATVEEIKDRVNAVEEFIGRFARYNLMSYYIKESMREEARNKLLILQKYIKRGIRSKQQLQIASDR